MDNFVALQNASTVMVRPTKWERQVGDKMNVDKADYVVIAYGSRSECIAAGNVEIAKINAFVRQKNIEIKRNLSAFFNQL